MRSLQPTRAASAVLLTLAAACSTLGDEMRPKGGGWYTRVASTHTGLARSTLYRKVGGVAMKVDENVVIRAFHPPDCLLYEANRRAGIIYAACGARVPVKVAAYPFFMPERGYHANADGLYRIDTVRVVDGAPTATVARVPIDEIRRIAEARPPLHPFWVATEASGLAIEPSITQEAVDVHARGPGGTTPLIEAARHGQLDVTEVLLAAGADVDAADSSGMTALEMAVGSEDADTAIVRRLLDAGADINVVGVTGRTPLMWTAIGVDTAMFRLLLEKGADPCLRDEEGQTIVDNASPERPAMHRAAVSAWARCKG